MRQSSTLVLGVCFSPGKVSTLRFTLRKEADKETGKYLFVIDPLDATTNYIKGIPLFDISVAVYEHNRNILGVIACPQLGELYVAEKGLGAYLNGEKIQVSSTNDINRAIIGYNRSHHPPEIIQSSKKLLATVLEQAASFRVFGTGGLDYCFLARESLELVSHPLLNHFTALAISLWKKLVL